MRAYPTHTVDSIFGAGASYGFIHASPDRRVRGGICWFHGTGPAEGQLALSARLPVRVEDLLDVRAGHTAGDPSYLLSSGMRKTIVTGGLVRSERGGGWCATLALAGGLPTRSSSRR